MPNPVETNNDQLTGKDDKNNDDLLYPYDSPLEMINNELGTFLSLKAKLVEVTEEHKISLTLNSKTVNSLVKMNEKTGCCHVILLYGLIPPSASKNRVHTVILPD